MENSVNTMKNDIIKIINNCGVNVNVGNEFCEKSAYSWEKPSICVHVKSLTATQNLLGNFVSEASLNGEKSCVFGKQAVIKIGLLVASPKSYFQCEEICEQLAHSLLFSKELEANEIICGEINFERKLGVYQAEVTVCFDKMLTEKRLETNVLNCKLGVLLEEKEG